MIILNVIIKLDVEALFSATDSTHAVYAISKKKSFKSLEKTFLRNI
jgi:hypothetical protein